MGELKEMAISVISYSGLSPFPHYLVQYVLNVCLPHVFIYSSGIGVPIMLAYVYGVVPISLCRSGGCGVSAGNGKGVRIEFDDENDMNVGSGPAVTGKV